ncbi:helix-turn-helix domain-containing protein [Paenibacillus sp. YK5]
MEGSVKMPIRSRIDDVIKTKGLKVSWVAQQLGISQSYFSQMKKTDERGILVNAMSAEYLVKLAHVLGCKVEDIAEYVEGEKS